MQTTLKKRFGTLIWCAAAAIGTQAGAMAEGVSPDPDGAKLVTKDIDRFWRVMDEATDENRAALLQTDYVEKGSVGVRGFTPNRIISGEALDQKIRERPESYSPGARARMLRVTDQAPAIRAAFHELKRLYPPAVFPDVYFVVGRLNSGGTSSNAGLLIGAEMYASSDEEMTKLTHIVAHEWAHFNQEYPPLDTLLAKAIQEGSADFLSELASGAHINAAAHEFGLAREAEVWARFESVMRDPPTADTTAGWMYGGSPFEGGPADLAYFVGYRICQAHYEQSRDKQASIHEMLNARDFEEFLAASGYADGFDHGADD